MIPGYFNKWMSFLSMVGKRLTAISVVNEPGHVLQHVYFLFDDGNVTVLYGQKIFPSTRHKRKMELKDLVDMVKKSPTGSKVCVDSIAAQYTPVLNPGPAIFHEEFTT